MRLLLEEYEVFVRDYRVNRRKVAVKIKPSTVTNTVFEPGDPEPDTHTHTCTVGGKTRPLTSAALRRSAMASSLLLLANNHLAEWGSTLVGIERSNREVEKMRNDNMQDTHRNAGVFSCLSRADFIFRCQLNFSPYIEAKQEARG